MGTINNTQTILLGGGCFWCIEAIFKELQGVLEVAPGYAGGQKEEPTYQEVCTSKTGHAEVLKVKYDTTQISTASLLKIFFTIHDPTQLDRQGEDVGPQYRSVIFANKEQQKVADEVIKEIEASKIWDKPIVTSVEGETKFWPAEAYHSNYFENNPDNAYCSAVVAPKVLKARKLFKAQLKSFS